MPGLSDQSADTLTMSEFPRGYTRTSNDVRRAGGPSCLSKPCGFSLANTGIALVKIVISLVSIGISLAEIDNTLVKIGISLVEIEKALGTAYHN